MIDETKPDNARADALTGTHRPPLDVTIRNASDLAELRQRWSQVESTPLLREGREEGVDHSWGGLDIRTILRGEESSGRFSFHDVVLAPGVGLPPHYHEIGDTFMWVIEGEVDLRIGALTERVGRRAFGYAPARTRQAVSNPTQSQARVLIAYGPAGADHAFAAAHQRWAATGDKAETTYLEILGRFGFRFDDAALENDQRTNAKPTRLEAEIRSFGDFAALRENWKKRAATPKLVRSPPADDNVTLPGVASKVLLSGDEGSGHAVVFMGVTEPLYAAPPHHQPSEEEIFYVLDGHLKLTCGSATKVVGPGGFGFAPRNATHGFVNPDETPSRIITINSPAGHERGFEMIMREMESEQFPELLVAHGWRMHDEIA